METLGIVHNNALINLSQNNDLTNLTEMDVRNNVTKYLNGVFNLTTVTSTNFLNSPYNGYVTLANLTFEKYLQQNSTRLNLIEKNTISELIQLKNSYGNDLNKLQVELSNLISKLKTQNLDKIVYNELIGTISIFKGSLDFWQDAKNNINNPYYKLLNPINISSVTDPNGGGGGIFCFICIAIADALGYQNAYNILGSQPPLNVLAENNTSGPLFLQWNASVISQAQQEGITQSNYYVISNF